MQNPTRATFKTCVTCKRTFPTIRELIEHEKAYHKSIQSPIAVNNANDHRSNSSRSIQLPGRNIIWNRDTAVFKNLNDGKVEIGFISSGLMKRKYVRAVLCDNGGVGGNVYACDYCLRPYFYIGPLNKHLRDYHGNAEKAMRYYCWKCKAHGKMVSFSTKEELLEHMKTKRHGKIIRPTQAGSSSNSSPSTRSEIRRNDQGEKQKLDWRWRYHRVHYLRKYGKAAQVKGLSKAKPEKRIKTAKLEDDRGDQTKETCTVVETPSLKAIPNSTVSDSPSCVRKSHPLFYHRYHHGKGIRLTVGISSDQTAAINAEDTTSQNGLPLFGRQVRRDYACDYCLRPFLYLASLNRHLRFYHGHAEEAMRYYCWKCKIGMYGKLVAFSTKDELLEHMRTKRHGKIIRPTGYQAVEQSSGQWAVPISVMVPKRGNEKGLSDVGAASADKEPINFDTQKVKTEVKIEPVDSYDESGAAAAWTAVVKMEADQEEAAVV